MNTLLSQFKEHMKKYGANATIDGIETKVFFKEELNKNGIDTKFMFTPLSTPAIINQGSVIDCLGVTWIAIDKPININNSYDKTFVLKSNYTMKIILDENLYQFPILLVTKTLNVVTGKYLSVADGKVMVTLRTDDKTNLIKTDDRVILLHQAFKCDGIDTSIEGLTTLYFSSTAIDTTNDDLINEIADKNKLATYSIAISNGTEIQADITHPLQLNVVVNKIVGGVSSIVSNPNVVYSSSDTSIATVDSNGLAIFQKVGNVNITASLAPDGTVTSCIVVTVVSVPKDNFVLSIAGNTTVKLGSTNTFTASLTNNGVLLPNSAFDFVLDTKTTPSNAYTYVVNSDNSSVSIKTLKYPYTIGLTAYLRNNHGILSSVNISLKGVM